LVFYVSGEMCTKASLLQCAVLHANTIPVCDKNESPAISNNSCCPTCIGLPPCNESPDSIPVCASLAIPSINLKTGCPTCKVGCTAAQVSTCLKNVEALPDCAMGASPQRTVDCCVSCKPAVVQCNLTAAGACPDVDVACTNGSQVWDPSTCCRTCSRPLPPVELRPDPVTDKCTLDALAACLADIPVCQVGETPEFNKTFCCATCKRPEDLCTKDEVVTCIQNRPMCPAGVPPAYVLGECCPNCQLSPPNCTADCSSDNETCVRTLDGPNCRTKLELRLRIKAIQKIENFDRIYVKLLLVEIVNRFCEQSVNAERCTGDILNIIQDSLDCPEYDNVTGEATLTVAAGDSSNSRRRDSSDTTDLVADSSNDPNSNSGYTVESGTATSSSMASSSMAPSNTGTASATKASSMASSTVALTSSETNSAARSILSITLLLAFLIL